jgi:cobalt-zinc-cadmium resistance protein CzcA
MDEAVAIALANHPVARNVVLAEQKDILMQQQAVELAPLQIKYWQRNAQADNDRLLSVTQNFGSIPEHFRRAQHYRTVTSTRQAERTLTLDELTWHVKAAYMDVVYFSQQLHIMQEHDHYFEALIDVAEIRLSADSIPELTRVSAGTSYAAYQSRMYIAEEELKRAETQLRLLMYIPDGKIETDQTELKLYQIHPDKAPDERFEPVKHKLLDEAQLAEAKSAVTVEKTKLFPDIHAGYINQHIEGMNNFHGWMLGLSVPLWMQPQRARIKQAEIDVKMKANETDYRQFADMQHVEILKSLLNEYFVQVSFYRENLLVEAELALEEVEKDFSAGNITNYSEAFVKVNHAVSAKLKHLGYINLYNQTALELEYFTQ